MHGSEVAYLEREMVAQALFLALREGAVLALERPKVAALLRRERRAHRRVVDSEERGEVEGEPHLPAHRDRNTRVVSLHNQHPTSPWRPHPPATT